MGFVRRLIIIRFPFKFTDNPNPNNEMEKLGDRTMESYFKNDMDIRQQFMLILLEYYNEHIKGNKIVTIPQEVRDVTKEYLQANNVVGNFIREHLEVGTTEDRIILKDLYTTFKAENDGNKMPPSTFKDQMEINGYKSYESRLRDEIRDNVVIAGLKLRGPIMDPLEG